MSQDIQNKVLIYCSVKREIYKMHRKVLRRAAFRFFHVL